MPRPRMKPFGFKYLKSGVLPNTKPPCQRRHGGPEVTLDQKLVRSKSLVFFFVLFVEVVFVIEVVVFVFIFVLFFFVLFIFVVVIVVLIV